MQINFGVMWVWTWYDPVVIIYSIDVDGRMYFHSIKAAEEYQEEEGYEEYSESE